MMPQNDLDQLLAAAGAELPPPPSEATERARRAALRAAGIDQIERLPQSRRRLAIVLIAAAVVLVLGIGLAVASQVFDGAAPVVRERYPIGPDPGFLYGNGWHTAASHSATTPREAIAVASTTRFDRRDFAARAGNFRVIRSRHCRPTGR